MKLTVKFQRESDIEYTFEGIAMPMTRRVFPQLFSNVTVGVQPLSKPAGLAYALRSLGK